jgi:hypothetical protein
MIRLSAIAEAVRAKASSLGMEFTLDMLYLSPVLMRANFYKGQLLYVGDIESDHVYHVANGAMHAYMNYATT